MFLLTYSVFYGQFNFSSTQIVNPIPPTTPAAPSEIFRFQPGNVTQLDAGTGFGFTSSRWFSLGRLNTGTQTVYGLRFQLPNKAVTFGYQDISDDNPRLQWIGTGANLGDFEFRVANSFNSTFSTLVATMTNDGNTIFGDPNITGNNAKVSIDNSTGIGLLIQSSIGNDGFAVNCDNFSSLNTGGKINVSNASQNDGLLVNASSGNNNTGVRAESFGGNSSIGVLGIASNSNFSVAIYGKSDEFAGFFDGDVFYTGSLTPSDVRLKENIKPETNVLEKLSQLNAVTYNFKNIDELNLSKGMQHGFIAQELVEIFPELTKDIKKPIFDNKGKIVSYFEFKSVNYEGLIPILTKAVNQLNEEIMTLKEEIENLKETNSNLRLNNEHLIQNKEKAILEQNIPNPFSDKTTIRYQYQKNAGNASLIVFDMNGKIVKEFPLYEPNGYITIDASQIGKGLFIYGLFQNGQELITKKMLIK